MVVLAESVEFVISHSSVSIRRSVRSPFVGFVCVVDKSFVKASVVVDIC